MSVGELLQLFRRRLDAASDWTIALLFGLVWLGLTIALGQFLVYAP